MAADPSLRLGRDWDGGKLMERGYSLLTVKTVDEAQRVIEGTATVPSVDRMGDEVLPLGAKFKLPLPLLWQHKHDQPIGHVEWAQPRADGIPFRARLAKVPEPGRLKDRLDEAWQSIKAGLVRGVSIGFMPLKVQPTATGVQFTEWEWFELSAVTIPANAEASIATIKAAYAASRDEPSSIWRQVADAGQRALVETRGLPGYERSTPAMRMASEARGSSMAMVRALAERVDDLERRLAEGRVDYRGVWSAGQEYRRGNLVTLHGNIFHCNRQTDGKPGEDHDGWTLAVRKGRDGKDLRP